MKSKDVNRKIQKELIREGLNQIDSHEPYVTFAQNPSGEFLNTVNILAFVPSKVENFEILGPGEKEIVKTDLGEISTRTIRIKWMDEVKPSKRPHDLWYITVDYSAIKPKIKDEVIRVVYEYGDPITSRGTVTTTGTPT